MGNLISYINENYSFEEEYKRIFNRTLNKGKFSCPNPEHHHVSNTPSCKLYGNVAKCFGNCNRTFGVYDLWKWYSPERINEVKTTLIIPPEQEVKKSINYKVPVDLSKPLKQILDTIING